jgi:hypothetical protein
VTVSLIIIGSLFVVAAAIFGALERFRAPSRAERLAYMASTPEAERLIGGVVPDWCSPAIRDGVGVYGARTLYYAGREHGHSAAVMQRRLTKWLDESAPRAVQTWWFDELAAAVAAEKRLPKARPTRAT